MIDLAKIKELFFDRKAVLDAADKGAVRALSKFGAYVRTRARSSIKKAPKREATIKKRGLVRSGGDVISAPGQPPVGHTGLLRDHIYFAYDDSSKSVVIGPAPAGNSGGVGARALEQGGLSRSATGKALHIRARPFMRPAFDAELPRAAVYFKGMLK